MSRRPEVLIRCGAALLLSALLAACSSDAAPACQSDLDCFDGEACQGGSCTAVACLEPARACNPDEGPACCEGTYCAYDEPCNVSTEDGCFTRGTCEPKREPGEPCDDASQCAGPGAFCSGPAEGPATCKIASEELDQQRCEENADCSNADGIRRACEDTYCRRMSGEPCEANNECASNLCSPLVNRNTCT